jgi:hypothetical protein
MWYDRRLGRVRLQGLHTFSNKRAASIGYRGAIDLQQAPQERDVVCPFLLRRVPEGERAFDAECISPEGLVLLVQSWRLSQPVLLYHGQSLSCTVFCGVARCSWCWRGAPRVWWREQLQVSSRISGHSGSGKRLSVRSARFLHGTCRSNICVQLLVACCHAWKLRGHEHEAAAIGDCETHAPTLRHSHAHGCGRSDQDSNISSRTQTPFHDLTGLLTGLMAPRARHGP